MPIWRFFEEMERVERICKKSEILRYGALREGKETKRKWRFFLFLLVFFVLESNIFLFFFFFWFLLLIEV